MAQLSRPYQIALGAVAVLALVWFVALRGHSSNPSEPSSASAPARSSSPAGSSAQSSSPAAPSKIYHGPAPGVEGLTRDVAKAHGAVATSERNAAQLQRSSAQASGEAAATGGASASASTSGSRSAAERSHAKISHSKTRSAAHGQAKSGAKSGGSHGSSSATARAPQQIEVEHEISQGKTVLLLFWEPKSSVDNTVRSQVLALGKGSKGKLAVHVALAEQVGLFGPVTEVAHVYQTPTVLIVNRHGLVTTLTGLVDKFSLQQAVREAQHANR